MKGLPLAPRFMGRVDSHPVGAFKQSCEGSFPSGFGSIDVGKSAWCCSTVPSAMARRDLCVNSGLIRCLAVEKWEVTFVAIQPPVCLAFQQVVFRTWPALRGLYMHRLSRQLIWVPRLGTIVGLRPRSANTGAWTSCPFVCHPYPWY
jgi:hypothetical protein